MRDGRTDRENGQSVLGGACMASCSNNESTVRNTPNVTLLLLWTGFRAIDECLARMDAANTYKCVAHAKLSAYLRSIVVSDRNRCTETASVVNIPMHNSYKQHVLAATFFNQQLTGYVSSHVHITPLATRTAALLTTGHQLRTIQTTTENISV